MSKNNNLEIEILTLGELQTNCYLAWCRETLECIIIDPADSGDYISERILELQLKPLCIVFTHGHFDHVLGSLELKLNFDIPIFMNHKDNDLLSKAQKSAQYWTKRVIPPVPQTTSPISEGTTFEIGNSKLEVLETPGHTPGSVVLFANETQTILFSGDTLFKDGVGRTDFAYSSPKDLQQSIQKLFDELPENTLCYPGHGASTVLRDEQK